MRRVLIGPFLVGALLARPVRSGADEPLQLSGTGEVIASYLRLDEIQKDPASPVIQGDEAKTEANHQCANDGADDGTGAAHQAVAAEHRRGDHR